MLVCELLYTTGIRDMYPVFAGRRRSFVFTSFEWKKQPTDGETSTGPCLARFSKLFIAVVALYSKRNSNVPRKSVPLQVLYMCLQFYDYTRHRVVMRFGVEKCASPRWHELHRPPVTESIVFHHSLFFFSFFFVIYFFRPSQLSPADTLSTCREFVSVRDKQGIMLIVLILRVCLSRANIVARI